eukprot:jgi/Undpi1/636/HiC_scaffold_10.g04100.m1
MGGGGGQQITECCPLAKDGTSILFTSSTLRNGARAAMDGEQDTLLQREPAIKVSAAGVRRWRRNQKSPDGHCAGPGYRRRLPRQRGGASEAALAVGPLRVTSLVVKPLAHGELYRRPPGRVSGLEPLKHSGSGGALLNSLAPIEPHAFDPRLHDTESLCVGSGISRGAAITSRATAVRHRQLQYRHRMHQNTHKAARLVQLISAIRERDQTTSTGGGESST